jgi:hypothetical protein
MANREGFGDGASRERSVDATPISLERLSFLSAASSHHGRDHVRGFGRGRCSSCWRGWSYASGANGGSVSGVDR